MDVHALVNLVGRRPGSPACSGPGTQDVALEPLAASDSARSVRCWAVEASSGQ